MGAMDDRSIAQAAAKAGVMVMALSTAYAGKPVRRGLILGYAAHDEDAIAAAARRLGEIMAAAA
jgi:GntR family transcriptional regulator/MocR family aminotransferase